MTDRKRKTRKPRAAQEAAELRRRSDTVKVDELLPRLRSRAGGAKQEVDPIVSPQVVWYRLLKLTNLMGRPFFTRFAQQYELSINDWRVVTTLASMPEAASHELCQVTGMHPMNVSRSVATLRKQGRVSERTDPTNRRRKILSLTDKGWEVYNHGVPQVRRMAQFLFSSMSPLEVEFFDRLVDLLVDRLEEVDLESDMFVGELPESDPVAE
ncbi:MAG TPA: MarR family winged helix-turn-helix transcriptional regulator [Alphaproteobacteria bacterium]|nr:MarR family winged helix-turn-helix transcriptional regulator [Alphaproteobacteria bacterium]